MTTRLASTTIGVGGARPWEPESRPPDDAPLEEVDAGRSFLVNVDELRPALAETAEMLAGIEVPAGFHPLQLGTLVEIVRSMQLKRQGTGPGGSVARFRLAYRPRDGYFYGAESVLDQLGMDTGHSIDPRKCVLVLPCAYPSPTAGGNFHRLSAADVLALALEDAAQVAEWFWDPATARCWHPSDPHPCPVEDETAGAALLSASVRRSIMRTVRARCEQLPPHLLADAGALVFDPMTAECHGQLVWPPDRPDSHFLRIRTVSDDPDYLAGIEDELARVRVCRSGRVLPP